MWRVNILGVRNSSPSRTPSPLPQLRGTGASLNHSHSTYQCGNIDQETNISEKKQYVPGPQICRKRLRTHCNGLFGTRMHDSGLLSHCQLSLCHMLHSRELIKNQDSFEPSSATFSPPTTLWRTRNQERDVGRGYRINKNWIN